MSDSSQNPTPSTSTGETQEKTFSKYTPSQGAAYSAVRRSYHPSLYSTLLSHHTTTGGHLNTVLDIGCGPGLATRTLATHFQTAIGLDPSSGMISTALTHGGHTLSSTPIRYFVSTGEQLGSNLTPPIPDASVDLITIANAAHWISMPEFWSRAAEVLRPGGSVAIWSSGGMRAHPSMPNHLAIQAAMDEIRDSYLLPYFEPGNYITRDSYRTLQLPWTVVPPIPGFSQETFYRKDWEEGEEFYEGNMEVDMRMFERMMGTGSPVTRWREKNPGLVGTEGDVVRVMRRRVEGLLREGGVVREEDMRVRGVNGGFLLVVKRV